MVAKNTKRKADEEFYNENEVEITWIHKLILTPLIKDQIFYVSWCEATGSTQTSDQVFLPKKKKKEKHLKLITLLDLFIRNIGQRGTCQSPPNWPSPKREEFCRNCWFLQQINGKKTFFRRQGNLHVKKDIRQMSIKSMWGPHLNFDKQKPIYETTEEMWRLTGSKVMTLKNHS